MFGIAKAVARGPTRGWRRVVHFGIAALLATPLVLVTGDAAIAGHCTGTWGPRYNPDGTWEAGTYKHDESTGRCKAVVTRRGQGKAADG